MKWMAVSMYILLVCSHCLWCLGWALSGCVISLAALAEMPPQLGQGWDMFWKDRNAGYLLCSPVLWTGHRTEEMFVSAPGAGYLSDLQLLAAVWSTLNLCQGVDNGWRDRDLGWCCGGVGTPLTLNGPVRRAGHICSEGYLRVLAPRGYKRGSAVAQSVVVLASPSLSLVVLCCFGWS